MTANPPSVCLAISSFRNDESVLALLETAIRSEYFDEILVVDSLGTGALPTALAERNWTDRVVYENHAENLGSAGNLARRLELAAERNHDWVYAVNHDGEVDARVVRELVRWGEHLPDNFGAIYPLRYLTGRRRYDLTGTAPIPTPFFGPKRRPSKPFVKTYWSSSNGALYALEPVRRGKLPWADLWMGWEDLGYGWLLHREGYRQVIVTTVQIDDTYEYTEMAPHITVAAKPSWYAYYQARNMVLVTRRLRAGLPYRAAATARILLEFAVTTAFRSNKTERYGLLIRGIYDGIRNRSGKWRLP